MSRRVAHALAVACGIPLLVAAAPALAGHRPNNEVLLGGAISQTGRYAEPATRQVNSINLGVDEVNARGGLLGHKIVLRLLDSGTAKGQTARYRPAPDREPSL